MRPYPLTLASLFCLALLAAGCAADPAILARTGEDDACARAQGVAQDAQAQLSALRAEMAATRIAGAKKEAELLELRRQLKGLLGERAKLHEVEVELRETVEAQEASLRTLQAERDHLVKAKDTLEAALAKVSSRTREPIAHPPSAPVQAKVDALEASIVALTTQIQQLHVRDVGPASGPVGGELASIRVKRGDTLSKLAARHGVSVDDLRRANGLSGDLILAGQQLFIPRTALETRSER